MFKLSAKHIGGAVRQAQAIIFDRLGGDVGAVREIIILDIQKQKARNKNV